MSRTVLKPEEAELALSQLQRIEIEAAASEVERELKVRERCFDRWVNEGKISRIDAKDRFDRQLKALEILQYLLDSRPTV